MIIKLINNLINMINIDGYIKFLKISLIKINKHFKLRICRNKDIFFKIILNYIPIHILIQSTLKINIKQHIAK